MERFWLVSSTVITEYGVTSLPVPAVVPTKITGRAGAVQRQAKTSAGFSNWLVAKMATAFAASSGEPPPMPTMKSA